MEFWRKAWREGIVPQLSLKGLTALRDALVQDDPRLVQVATALPVLSSVAKVEAACALGYCAWMGDSIETVGGVRNAFDAIIDAADNVTADDARSMFFISWFDETPREQMRLALLPEVEKAIVVKGGTP